MSTTAAMTSYSADLFDDCELLIIAKRSYSSFAEDNVSIRRRVDVDVRTTDDKNGVLLTSNGHLCHSVHRLQSYHQTYVIDLTSSQQSTT